MASGDLLINTGFAIIAGAIVAVVFFQYRLRHYVSKEKVHALEDVSQLWKRRVPPKKVLNKKGLRLSQYSIVSLVIFLIGVGLVLFEAIYGKSFPPYALQAIVVGAVVALMFF